MKGEWSSPARNISSPTRAQGGLKPLRPALLALLIRVQKKTRERAVFVVVASVRLPAVQLHVHLVP